MAVRVRMRVRVLAGLLPVHVRACFFSVPGLARAGGSQVWVELVRAGVRRFKCATTKVVAAAC